MAQPLLATSKLTFEYVVQGVLHKYDAYMAYNDVLGQHQMVDRDGITTILWTVGAQTLWNAARQFWTAGDVLTPATLKLFKYAAPVWNLIDTAALTGIGSGGGPISLASQVTYVLRDTAFKFVRAIWLECNQGYVGHSPNGSGISGVLTGLSDEYTGVNPTVSAPYRWQKSRGDRFLAATNAVAGLTLDLNDKLKRRRGLE